MIDVPARPEVLFLGLTYAGHRTRFENLEAHIKDDPRIRAVVRHVDGWEQGGLIERLPLLPDAFKGRIRAVATAAPLARLPRPDVIWTSAGEATLPHLWSQVGPLRRPLVIETDWTLTLREEIAPIYFRRPARSGLRMAIARLQERALWSRTSLFLPWSNWAAESLRAQGVPAERVRVLPPGIDLGLWQPASRAPRAEDEPLRLLFVGGDFWRKGGDIVVDLVRERFAGRCELDIVTRDEMVPAPGVRVHRAEPNSAVLRERYAQADLFVMPSRAEAFGIATVEAMASGLPVIVGAVGGCADIVDDGRTGWLVQPEHEGVAAALERALANREALPGMGRLARTVVEQRFDAQRNARVLVDLLVEQAQSRANDARARRALGDLEPPAEQAPRVDVRGMRIALFVNSVAMGGVEQHVRQIAATLRTRGAEVLVICPELPVIDPLAHVLAEAGVRVRRLTLSRGLGVRRSAEAMRSLVALLRRERIQVLHVHLVGYTGGRWALLAAQLARVPATVVTIQITPSATEPWRTRLDRRVTTIGVDRFIAVSKVSRQRLVDYLGQSGTKTEVIPNAVELDRYEGSPALGREAVRTRHGVPPDALLLGSVARLAPQKGLAYLIDALPAIVVEQPRAHVLLVGDGPLRDQLEAQATRLGVRDRVHFAGQQEDIPSYLQAMDLFVLPSLFEGLPLAVLEAMAAGLAVVATGVDGTPEAVDDGVTGLLVPARDSEAFASAVLKVLGDPATHARMRSAARARAREFSVEALVDRVSAVYADALGRK